MFKMMGILCIGIMIYFLGISTSQYRLFPYYELRYVKNYILGDITAKADTARPIKKSSYYNRKSSFFDEFQHNANIIMLGDSKTDIAEWQLIFPTEKIANYGINGDTTAGVLSRLQQINTQNNPKVFIMLGINDLIRGEEIEDIFYNYNKIVEHLLASNASVYIQSTLFISKKNSRQHEKFYDINRKVFRLNNLLKHIADESGRVTYIDINSILSSKLYLDEKYIISNQSLNGAGYRVWSNLIRPYVISNS